MEMAAFGRARRKLWYFSNRKSQYWSGV